MILPELDTELDALRCEEVVVVLPPGRHFLRRARHELDDFRLRLRFSQECQHRLALEGITGCHVVDEADDLRPLQIEAGGRGVTMAAGRGRGLRDDGREGEGQEKKG